MNTKTLEATYPDPLGKYITSLKQTNSSLSLPPLEHTKTKNMNKNAFLQVMKIKIMNPYFHAVLI